MEISIDEVRKVVKSTERIPRRKGHWNSVLPSEIRKVVDLPPEKIDFIIELLVASGRWCRQDYFFGGERWLYVPL